MAMEKPRGKHSREFKIEAVRRSYESGKSITTVAKELDINVAQLYRWRDDIKKLGDQVYPGRKGRKKQPINNDEINHLRQENKRLQDERDILKKTLILFASEHAKDIKASESTEANTR